MPVHTPTKYVRREHDRAMAHPVTFVIGAGASSEFGLPTGNGLLCDVLAQVPKRQRRFVRSPSGDIVANDIHPDEGESEAKSFAFRLSRSGLSSIDRFLERNQNDEGYGKFAIAWSLHRKEVHALRNGSPTSNWHSWLIERLLKRERELFGGRFTFISFNYDRLLWTAFYSMIRYAHGCSETEALDLVSKIPIHHVYGSFQYEPQQIYNLPSDTSYEPRVRECEEAALGIKIIPQHREADDSTLLQCQQAIAGSRKLVFLGFGFDLVNVERIGAVRACEPSTSTRTVFASAYQVESAERTHLHNLLGENARLGEYDHNCLKFLRATCADWLEE